MAVQWGKAAALALAGVLAAGSLQTQAAAAETAANAARPVTIVLDGYPLPFDAEPYIENGSTLVPFRTIGEALGITVDWSETTKSVRARGIGADGQPTDVTLQVGNRNAIVDGKLVPLPAPPRKKDGRVMIPLKFFGSQFGADTRWESATRTVVIDSPQRRMHLRAFYALSSYDEVSLVPRFDSVAFGWSRIGSDGAFTLEGPEYRWPKPAGDVTPESIVADVRESAEADAYLMVFAGDSQRELTKQLTDPELMKVSIDQIVNVINNKGFTGVLLDYEGLGWKDAPEEPRRLLNAYVRLLRERLPEGVRLSLAVPPPNGAYKGYDYDALAETADDLVLMAYDYNTKKGPEPLDKVDEAIRLTLAAGVPKEKLLLGISVDSENEDSIGSKLGLAKRYSLKGAAFWRLGLFGREIDAVSAEAKRIGV